MMETARSAGLLMCRKSVVIVSIFLQSVHLKAVWQVLCHGLIAIGGRAHSHFPDNNRV
jgi:hypothetical protein